SSKNEIIVRSKKPASSAVIEGVNDLMSDSFIKTYWLKLSKELASYEDCGDWKIQSIKNRDYSARLLGVKCTR
ncbi:MAG: hypothetical protein NWF13_09870, partial [Candidatus Bathyarchaeota archaeon]|nr:hypothetical protein [Candidatus Bathyarchaeota archaeon]